MLNPLKKLTVWAQQGPRTLAPAAAWGRSRRDWLAEHDPVYRSWSRPGRAEKLAATTALGLIAALLLALALFD